MLKIESANTYTLESNNMSRVGILIGFIVAILAVGVFFIAAALPDTAQDWQPVVLIASAVLALISMSLGIYCWKDPYGKALVVLWGIVFVLAFLWTAVDFGSCGCPPDGF